MNIRGLYRNGRHWYFQPAQRNGQRPRAISLGTTDEAEAITKVLELRGRQAGEIAPPGSIEREGKDHLARLRKTGAQVPSTLDDLERTVNQFADVIGRHRLVDSIDQTDVDRYLEELKRRNYKPNTIRTYGARLAGFFNGLVRAGVLRSSPWIAKLPKPRRTRKNVFCTADERNLLIESCGREDLEFFLWCGFHAGMRYNEIDKARPDWFEWDPDKGTGQIIIQPGEGFQPKGLDRRIIPIPTPFVEFLERYGKRSPFMLRPDKPLGKNRYRFDVRVPFNKLTEEQGLAWVTPHIMRHTYATLHIRAKTPPAVLAQWFGADLKVMMEIYTGYYPDQETVNATI